MTLKTSEDRQEHGIRPPSGGPGFVRPAVHGRCAQRRIPPSPFPTGFLKIWFQPIGRPRAAGCDFDLLGVRCCGIAERRRFRANSIKALGFGAEATERGADEPAERHPQKDALELRAGDLAQEKHRGKDQAGRQANQSEQN